MTTHTETDWAQFTFPSRVGSTEYSITVNVFLTISHAPDPHHWPPWQQKIDASLNGFDTLPPYAPEHEKELERRILMEIEERYPQP